MTWLQGLIAEHGTEKALEIWRRENDEYYAAHPQRRLPVEKLMEIEWRQEGCPSLDERRQI